MSKTDPPVLERHRRIAADAFYSPYQAPEFILTWIHTGDVSVLLATEDIMIVCAQMAATIERDAINAERTVTVIGARNFGIDVANASTATGRQCRE